MKITISQNAGFFSCCSVILYFIIYTFNKYKKLPDIIDTSNTFKNLYNSYYNDYFDLQNIIITYNDIIEFNMNYQVVNPDDINYNNLKPFLKKYFTPNEVIVNIKKHYIDNYKIDINNTCAIYFRGTDKYTEFTRPDWSKYIDFATNILKENKDIVFLVQSDEQEFIDYFSLKFSNSIIIKDKIIEKSKETIANQNGLFNIDEQQKLMAIVLIMAECKHVLCNISNLSLWIALYRGNSKNYTLLHNIENIDNNINIFKYSDILSEYDSIYRYSIEL